MRMKVLPVSVSRQKKAIVMMMNRRKVFCGILLVFSKATASCGF